MKYRVKIVIREVFTTWVEAEDEYMAEHKAQEQLDKGDLFPDQESVTTEIIDTDEED